MLTLYEIKMTADVYGHLFPSANDSAELREAEKFFWRKRDPYATYGEIIQ